MELKQRPLTFGFDSSPLFLEYDAKMKSLQKYAGVKFSLDEFLYSQTAWHMNLKNEPNREQMENLCRLVSEVLYKARLSVRMPIYVNSGFRSAALNNAVGGAAHSYHMQGRAADVTCPYLDKLYRTLEKLPHLELIQYKTFIHVAL